MIASSPPLPRLFAQATRSLRVRLSLNYALRSCAAMALLMWVSSLIIGAADFYRLTRPERVAGEFARALDPLRTALAEGAADSGRLTAALIEARARLIGLEDYDFMGNLYRITASSTPLVRLTLSQPDQPALEVGDADLQGPPLAALSLGEPARGVTVALRFRAEFSPGRELANDTVFVLGAWPIVLISSVTIGILCGAAASRYVVSRLGRMNVVIERWRAGDFTPRILLPPGDELTLHADHLNAMAEDLSAYVALRNRLAVREERDRVARDLHDTVKQKLFALTLQIATIQSRLAQGLGAPAHLAEAEAILREAQRDVAAMLGREDDPAGPGLAEAAQRVAADFARRFGIAIDQRIEAPGLSAGAQTGEILKILQECLTNVARHSAASRAEIHLGRSARRARLIVRDDGRGFDPQAVAGGVGLRSIAARAQALPGGRCDIAARLGGGCQITISWDDEADTDV